jgi:plastocyanin
MRTLSTIVMAACLLGGIACSGGSDEPSPCPDPTETTSVVMSDFAFGPSCLRVDRDATVSLDNEGATPHTFTLDDAEVNADVPAGAKGSADLTGVTPDTYTVICTYHPQMVAALTITS